jgi:hypothetical protein
LKVLISRRQFLKGAGLAIAAAAGATLSVISCSSTKTDTTLFFHPSSTPSSSIPLHGDIKLHLIVNENYSCPFLFTWDGNCYQIENDIYSVARSKDREYTDFLFINNTVVPKQGAYFFQIQERQNEQSWTNMLNLITIDHPAVLGVGVDSLGNIHSYEKPLPPDSAFYKDNVDVLATIKSRDDIAVDMHHGDTLILDFSSVDTSAAAKLVVRVKGFEGELQGEYYPVVPAILIQTLNSGQWTTRHQFFPKDLWAEGVFDIKPFLTDSKMVRLLGISCNQGKYHMIDYVGLDNTSDKVACRNLEPLTAFLNDQTEVLSKIIDDDGAYAFMDRGDIITLTFPCNPMEDEKRDFVVASKGFYNPVGHSFYIYTWNGSSWVQRFDYAPPQSDVIVDTLAEFDLGAYLPDVDGEFKIKVEHKAVLGDLSHGINAAIDYSSLVVNGVTYPPIYANASDSSDILGQIDQQDQIYWDCVNMWAIIKFGVPKQSQPQ